MTRHSGIASRREVDGGIQLPGSRGDKYASPNSSSPAVSSLGRSNLERRLPAAPLSILDQDRIARIVLSGLIGFVLLLAGLLLFAGELLFDFFDLG